MQGHSGTLRLVTFLCPFFLAFFLSCAADDEISTLEDGSFISNPILQFRPHFARSLPVQILLIGVVTTLITILLIHLIFTAQYHWSLAPANYALQLSSVLTLLISLVATLHVILSTAHAESLQWPFMLSYISVSVPPFDDNNGVNEWRVSERNMWVVMNACTSGLIQVPNDVSIRRVLGLMVALQITHIQFLTLLFPSRLEGRLIFFLLGPLAAVATLMQLVPLRGDNAQILVASAVRNVCNATLSLLFTAFLFIWGFLVNRSRAWRTDGGTAAFGAAALGLALVSTGLTFLYVPREEEYVWLPGLMWSVVLWQSFFGWWWWVGAGAESGVWSSKRLTAGKRLNCRWKMKGRRLRIQDVFKYGHLEASHAATSCSVSRLAASPGVTTSRGFRPIRDLIDHVRLAHWTAVNAQAADQEKRRARQQQSHANEVLDHSGCHYDRAPSHEEWISWWGPLRRWRMRDTTRY